MLFSVEQAFVRRNEKRAPLKTPEGDDKGGITCKGIQDSLGFSILRCKFRIPGTGFQSLLVEVVFWIPNVSGILDFLSCIPDSKA